MLSFYEIDQYSFSPGPHTLTIAFAVSTGEQGEFVYEFTGLVRERMLILIVSLSSLLRNSLLLYLLAIAAVFGFPSNRGVIDITEGIEYQDYLQSSGFSYGTVPIEMFTLTYSQYADMGFNLEDSFDSDVIPTNAASG